MEYPPRVRALLDRAKADAGDTVVVQAKAGRYEGVVMPHHGFSGEDILTVKLSTGYNVGIEVREIDSIEVTAKRTPSTVQRTTRPPSKDRPTLAVLGTGGTIASYVDYRTGAVHPAVTAEELTGGAAGVVIPHGTDTLHFTTAALSFMLRDLTGPVVVVAAQRSSDRPSSDAALNLIGAARVGITNLGEVVAVMHGETSDTYATIHRGTKVRKMHSSRRDAFRSLNASPLGRVQPDGRVELSDHALPRAAGPTKVDDALDPRVGLTYFHPGQRPSDLEAILHGLHGLVIAGTGLGHVSHDLIPVIQKATKDGIIVVMTTQTLQGRVNLHVYDTGRDLLKAGAIGAEDMTPETALVKLMWVLGHTREPSEVARALIANVAGEINPRIGLDEFAE